MGRPDERRGREMATEWSSTPCRKRNCSRCCRHTEMPVSERDIADILALRLHQFPNVESFTTPTEQGAKTLANSPRSEACVFLVTESSAVDASGTCSIWSHRPEGCRIYPLILDQYDRPHLDEECPFNHEFPAPPVGLVGRLLTLAQETERM